MSCPTLKTSYQHLLSLKEALSLSLTEAHKTKDFAEVARLTQEIETESTLLITELIPFEKELGIKEQYHTQKEAYTQTGLLETREGLLGMEGIDGIWYSFPTLPEVAKRMKKEQELLGKKSEQGFTKMLIVPFGMSLKHFTETLRKTILAHYDPNPTETKLFSTNTDGTKKALDLNTTTPLYLWDKYTQGQGADVEGTLVYHPTVFDQTKHGGKTKKELLKEKQEAAYQILFLESTPIPRSGKGETTGGRKQIEAGASPTKYLESLQKNPLYQGERGLTPEAWLTQFLLSLQTKDQVIDDWDGNGSLNYNLGGYVPKIGQSGLVSFGLWDRGGARANLGWDDPGTGDAVSGARSAVMV